MSNGRQKIDVGSGYPDNNPKTALGITKPSLSKVPPAALLYTALAFMDGAYKYGAYNWRSKKVTASIYVDAAMRHLQAWFDGEEFAEDSKLPHLAHVLACIAILVDAKENSVLVDDRPPPGAMPRLLREWTAFLKQQAADRTSASAKLLASVARVRKPKRLRRKTKGKRK